MDPCGKHSCPQTSTSQFDIFPRSQTLAGTSRGMLGPMHTLAPLIFNRENEKRLASDPSVKLLELYQGPMNWLQSPSIIMPRFNREFKAFS